MNLNRDTIRQAHAISEALEGAWEAMTDCERRKTLPLGLSDEIWRLRRRILEALLNPAPLPQEGGE